MVGGEFQESVAIDWNTAVHCDTVTDIRVIIRRAKTRKIEKISGSGVQFNKQEKLEFLLKVIDTFRELHERLGEDLLLELEAERF